MSRSVGWILSGGVALAGVALLWWQREAMTPLRAEILSLSAQRAEAARLRNENERLKAADLSPAELERLQASRKAAEQLKHEIADLKTKLAEKPKPPTVSVPAPTRLVPGVTVSSAEWRNAGSATPEAALESVLWAAAGGDVEAFARRLVLDAKARTQAMALLESLPPALRAEYDTPEKLVAFLSIKDVPTGAAKVRDWMPPSGVIQPVEIALTSPDGAGREVRLIFAQPPSTSEWKLMVMPAAITKMATTLKGTPITAGAK